SGGFTGALDSSAGKITVGQNYDTRKGKISSSSDGLSYVFTPIAATQNFKIEATATVTMANHDSTSAASSADQEGFGMMLRDDIYLPISDNNSSAGAVIKSNYVASGMYNSGSSAPYTTNVIFSRENTSLSTTKQTLSSVYAVGDTMKISIERVGGGQSTTCTVECGSTTYTYTYTDFDFAASDYENAYICFFACRGTVVEFTNITLELGEIGQA
ncbi:MAG: hypothetical protein LUD47_05875, partial [Clostridia bacterium]|nr:hypothetical protein [Clostridia bacterium]